jgi:hypothetical protein
MTDLTHSDVGAKRMLARSRMQLFYAFWMLAMRVLRMR